MIDKLYAKNPYQYGMLQKNEIFSEEILKLTRHHYSNCIEYANILNSLDFNLNNNNIMQIPFIPVSLFKKLDLISVPREEIIKILTSSGTSQGNVSKIYLDKETTKLQFQALSRIYTSTISAERSPMIILDTESTIVNSKNFSARGAGILGFSNFARERVFAFDKDMKFDLEVIQDFIHKHKDEKIVLFGFTFIIWQHLVSWLQQNKIKIDIPNSILLHGGGWKKLNEESRVSKSEFKNTLKKLCNIGEVKDYYGMAEQTGSIFVECSKGYFHTSIYSDIAIRDQSSLKNIDSNKVGIIQLFSILPLSYPGHNILTEDIGQIFGIDDCKCGTLGKYFKVLGRLKKSEVRGCSDTYS